MRIYELMAIGATSGALKRRPSADVRCVMAGSIVCYCLRHTMPLPAGSYAIAVAYDDFCVVSARCVGNVGTHICVSPDNMWNVPGHRRDAINRVSTCLWPSIPPAIIASCMSGWIFASPPDDMGGMYRDIVETRLIASLHVFDRPSRPLSLHRACRDVYLRLHRMPMHGGRPRVRCGETSLHWVRRFMSIAGRAVIHIALDLHYLCFTKIGCGSAKPACEQAPTLGSALTFHYLSIR